MEVTKSLVVKLPTVTYGSTELFTSVKLGDGDLAPEQQSLPLAQRAQVLDQMANHLLIQNYLTEYNAVQAELINKYAGAPLYRAFPAQLENDLIQQGRIQPPKKG